MSRRPFTTPTLLLVGMTLFATVAVFKLSWLGTLTTAATPIQNTPCMVKGVGISKSFWRSTPEGKLKQEILAPSSTYTMDDHGSLVESLFSPKAYLVEDLKKERFSTLQAMRGEFRYGNLSLSLHDAIVSRKSNFAAPKTLLTGKCESLDVDLLLKQPEFVMSTFQIRLEDEP